MGFLKKLLGNKKKQQRSSQPKQQPPLARVKPEFPVGENHIDDPDIKTIDDLGKWYTLPKGFDYKISADGSPYIQRQTDQKAFIFLIEAGMLTFNEKAQRPDGKVIYNTTEVIKARR